MKSPSVRVVQAGWPMLVYIALDRPTESESVDRELIANDLSSIDEGVRLAEQVLRERGLRIGEWEAIGPSVRQAAVLAGGAA